MSDSSQYVWSESENITITLDLMDRLLEKSSLDAYERIALGTLLQNIYMGIENILRYQFQKRGIRINKTENWHKSLLHDACELNLVTEVEHPVFLKLLTYRHLHVHGYGHKLDEEKLRDLAEPVPSTVRSYLERLRQTYS